MRALMSISVLVLVVVISVLAASADAHASPEDEEKLQAAMRAQLVPRDIMEEVKRLLDEGVSSNAPGQFGRTAVHYAVGDRSEIAGTGALLNLLLAAGGDCCLQDNQGDTPLHSAVAEGIDALSDDSHIQSRIQSLLGTGADPDEPNRRGFTPHHFGAKASDTFGGPPLVNRLLQADANPNWSANDGNTPLHMAAGVSVILDSGHGHDVFNESNLTGDLIAAFGEDTFIIRALLAGGVNPNVTNAAGMTPFLVALKGASTSVADDMPIQHVGCLVATLGLP